MDSKITKENPQTGIAFVCLEHGRFETSEALIAHVKLSHNFQGTN